MKKITFIPNKGARIGHQFNEWIKGYLFCKKYNYEFYHHYFLANSEGMDIFLNLYFGEKIYNNQQTITKNQMSFKEYLNSNIDKIYKYDYFEGNDDITSELNEDMFVNDDIRNTLRTKFYSKHKKINYEKTISVHIRREDVKNDNSIFSSRYINIEYFINILNDLYKEYPDYEVRIFSSGVDDEFYNIKNCLYKNIIFHINDGVENTLMYMINSKILITSNSGLSYIASLISDKDNIKICPSNFWHKWPIESKLIEINTEILL